MNDGDEAPLCDCPPDAHGEHCTYHPDQVSGPQMSAQDAYLQRMQYAAGALLSKPDRELAPEELELFVKGAMALAEMFSEMDRQLSSGAAAPTAWRMDRNLMVDESGVPSSQLHIELKAQIESGVMMLVQQFEKLGKKTGAKLAAALGQVLVLQGRLISESVRLAVAHRVKPDQVSGGAPNLMVRGAQKPVTNLESVTKKIGRSSDREEP